MPELRSVVFQCLVSHAPANPWPLEHTFAAHGNEKPLTKVWSNLVVKELIQQGKDSLFGHKDSYSQIITK